MDRKCSNKERTRRQVHNDSLVYKVLENYRLPPGTEVSVERQSLLEHYTRLPDDPTVMCRAQRLAGEILVMFWSRTPEPLHQMVYAIGGQEWWEKARSYGYLRYWRTTCVAVPLHWLYNIPGGGAPPAMVQRSELFSYFLGPAGQISGTSSVLDFPTPYYADDLLKTIAGVSLETLIANSRGAITRVISSPSSTFLQGITHYTSFPSRRSKKTLMFVAIPYLGLEPLSKVLFRRRFQVLPVDHPNDSVVKTLTAYHFVEKKAMDELSSYSSLNLLEYKFPSKIGSGALEKLQSKLEAESQGGVTMVYQTWFMVFDSRTTATFRSAEDESNMLLLSSQQDPTLGAYCGLIHMINNILPFAEIKILKMLSQRVSDFEFQVKTSSREVEVGAGEELALRIDVTGIELSSMIDVVNTQIGILEQFCQSSLFRHKIQYLRACNTARDIVNTRKSFNSKLSLILQNLRDTQRMSESQFGESVRTEGQTQLGNGQRARVTELVGRAVQAVGEPVGMMERSNIAELVGSSTARAGIMEPVGMTAFSRITEPVSAMALSEVTELAGAGYLAYANFKIDSYKLETKFHDNRVTHTMYEWDLSTRRRRTFTWKRKKRIGNGAFGSVWLEEDERGCLRAVKKLRRDLADSGFTQELQALVKLREFERLFVHFLGWYENQDHIFLAMEYVQHGDLSMYLKERRNTKVDAEEITHQLLEGLEVLHEKGICHRDLKPQNILVACLDPIWVKIADFGVSKRTKNTALRTRCGTVAYQAPELNGLLPAEVRAAQEYAGALDIWSLGCLVHEILTAETPFLEKGSMTLESGVSDFCPGVDMGLLHKYCCGERVFPTKALQDSQVSKEGVSFVKSLLVANPKYRPTATHALQDPWLAGKYGDWCAELKSEFLSLGVNPGLPDQDWTLLRRQSRRTDIMLFLSPLARTQYSALMQEAIKKGYISAFLMLFHSPSSKLVDVFVLTNLLHQATEAGHMSPEKLQLDNLQHAGILQAAVEYGYLEVVKLLLRGKANANLGASRKTGRTVLQTAAGGGNIDMVRLLLDNNAAVNAAPSQDDGRTSLQAAAEGGYIDVVKLLLENHADVNAPPTRNGGRTALQAAAEGGHASIVELLLANHAEVNAPPAEIGGRTALEAATKGGFSNIARLLRDNAKVHAGQEQHESHTGAEPTSTIYIGKGV